jgi:hypothetical protein
MIDQTNKYNVLLHTRLHIVSEVDGDSGHVWFEAPVCTQIDGLMYDWRIVDQIRSDQIRSDQIIKGICAMSCIVCLCVCVFVSI